MPTPRAPSLRTGGGWSARGVALLGLLAACDTVRPKPDPGPPPAAPPVVAWGSTRGQASPPVIERPVAGLSPAPVPAGVETPAGAAEHNATVYPGAEELCGDGVVNDLARREAGVTAELCVEVDGTAGAFATFRFMRYSDREDRLTIADLGDLNGDGVHDLGAGQKDDALLLGEHVDWSTGEIVYDYSTRGSVLVLPGPLSPTTYDDPMYTWSLPEAVYGVDTADRIGAGIAGMGDLDGDGYGEFIFGNLGSPDMVWLASGPAFTDMAEAQLIYSEPAGGCASHGSASSPDLSGDGRPDVVIGNPCADLVLVYAGATLREGEGLPTPVARLQSGLGWREGFGGGLHADADLTGDGVADLVVGAPKANGVEGVDRPPYILVYPGPVRGTLWPDDAALRLTAEVVDEFTEGISQAGWGLSAGDADGDGYADLAVADPNFIDWAEFDEEAGWHAGRASVFLGPLSRSLLLNESATEIQSNAPWTDLGGQIDMRRDLDGDGRADLFVTAGEGWGESCTCGPADD